MKKIITSSLTCGATTETKRFHETINENISNMQKEGLEVEIKYQQSDNFLSALILGYKEVTNAE